jgi:hypothetical protein
LSSKYQPQLASTTVVPSHDLLYVKQKLLHL